MFDCFTKSCRWAEVVGMSAISIISPALCIGLQANVYLGSPLNLNASVFLSPESWQEGGTGK